MCSGTEKSAAAARRSLVQRKSTRHIRRARKRLAPVARQYSRTAVGEGRNTCPRNILQRDNTASIPERQSAGRGFENERAAKYCSGWIRIPAAKNNNRCACAGDRGVGKRMPHYVVAAVS